MAYFIIKSREVTCIFANFRFHFWKKMKKISWIFRSKFGRSTIAICFMQSLGNVYCRGFSEPKMLFKFSNRLIQKQTPIPSKWILSRIIELIKDAH